MIYKYYGPPGTGKTYRLISRAKAYARKGVPLDRIGYFAFTKKAADEAKESGSIYLDVGNSTLFPRLTGQTQPSTFTASIKDVDSTTILRLTSPFTSSDGRSDGSVHTYEYSDGDALTANIR